MNLDRNIYEGWTPRLFIEELEVTFQYQTFNDKKELGL